ncbi:MAG: proprotein convertase P-domain-containing protein, partial [Gammaproteobacteria bacterium]|nr:proprotein convertase P-domain-containing protein [Gammaproteobacteria bacterium]
SITVHVEIVHTYRGDLEVILVTPSGQTTTLESPSNDSADNISKDYTINASGIDSSGSWKLRVRDTYSQDTGYIDSWSITFP